MSVTFSSNQNNNNFNTTNGFSQNEYGQTANEGNEKQSPRESMNNIHKNARSKSMGVGKKQKGGKNQYGNNRMSKKQLEQQLKKTAEESKANSYFSCECQVCKTQVSRGHRFEIKQSKNLLLLNGKKIQFSKLIEYLLPPNEKIKGCQVLFPDTVFFAHGKPQFIAKCDREGCLIIIQQQSKLALQDIRQKFSTIVRERKKETQPIIFQSNNGIIGVKQNENEMGVGKENSLGNSNKLHSSPKAKSSINQNPMTDDEMTAKNNNSNNDEKSIFYKDTAVFRFIIDESSGHHSNAQVNNAYQQQDSDEPQIQLNKVGSQTQGINNYTSTHNLNNSDANNQSQLINIQDQKAAVQLPLTQQHPSSSLSQQPKQQSEESEDNFQTAAVKVVRDTEFINEFRRRANDEFWKTIDCIQTSIKAKTGIGHPIFVAFQAPINESDPIKDIDYSHFKVMPEDYELIKQEEDEMFCYKQCLKIAYYVSKVYNYEILQMKAEFLRDENGNIWFFFASNIQIRPSRNRTSHAYNLRNSASQKANQQKEQLIAEIEQYEQEQSVQQNKSIGRMLNIMDSYYSNMKSDMGIFQKQDFTEEDSKLDEVLRTLRPNTTANNFKEFLNRQDNITRSTHWKGIARRVGAAEQLKAGGGAKNEMRGESGNYRSVAVPNSSSQAQQQFMSKRVMSHDQRKNQQIQSLISALDQSALNQGAVGGALGSSFVLTKNKFIGNNKEAKNKELVKMLNNMNKSTNLSTDSGAVYSSAINGQYQSLNQSVASQKSVHLLGQTQRSLFQFNGPYSNDQKREQRSNFKAELVRNELLSRSDLMKLYQPPLKKSQLPTNNPFYTKTIVQLTQQTQPDLNLSQFKGNIITDKPYLDTTLSNDVTSQHSYFNNTSNNQTQYRNNIKIQQQQYQENNDYQPSSSLILRINN